MVEALSGSVPYVQTGGRVAGPEDESPPGPVQSDIEGSVSQRPFYVFGVDTTDTLYR